MKKFLCYDTNDAASGKIGVNSNGVLSPNATVPSTNGTSYQQLVTDGSGNAKWEDRLAYDNKTVLVEQTKITNAGRESIINLSLLANGSFVTVNIDGTEYNATLEEGGEYMLGTGATNCYYHIGNSGGINISSKTTFTSGYPFFVVIDADGKCMVLFDGESIGTEHTFGVYAGEIKQIDPKYIKDMYYDNSQSASYAIYTAGLISFPYNDGKLDIPLEMWKLLLDENATITDETTGSVMTNRTVVESVYGEAVRYDAGLPSTTHLYISTIYPQAYLLDGTKPDGQFGEKRTINVSIGTIKKIDPKYIPNTTVIVNITGTDGNYTADKTFSEVKALIDSGAEVKCMYDSFLFNYIGFSNEEKTSIGFEFEALALGVALTIVFATDSISVNFINLEKKLLPEVSASDNNKFLSVANGTWRASSNLIVPSSTSGSSKKFKITVDDSGVITATEV